MTLKEILTDVYNNIDEVDEDEQVEIIVKNAINEAYAELCAEDVRTSRAYVPVINGVATLPDGLISIIKMNPEKKSGDTIKGNSLITSNTGVIELFYTYQRDSLVNDDDEPDFHKSLVGALPIYAHYKYRMYRKKYNMAQLLLQEYNRIITQFRLLVKSRQENQSDVEAIQDVL